MVVLNQRETDFSGDIHKNVTPRKKRKRRHSETIKSTKSVASPASPPMPGYDQSMMMMMIGMLVGVGSATLILIEEASSGGFHTITYLLHLQTVVFITIWTGMGYYFFVTGNLRRQRECMNTVLLSTFIPGMFRIMLYSFQYWYYLRYGELYDDGDIVPYLITMAIMPILLVGIPV